jgi:MFS family permease
MLGIPTMSDSFVYLTLQQRYQITATAFPLFYVGTSLFMALFAVPCGRLADRVGRPRVLLSGYAALVLVYLTLFAAPSNPIAAVLPVALLGAYYAATDGVLTAMAAATLPKATSGTGLALLATATNVSRLFASVLFGLIWSRVGLSFATSVYLAGLVLAIVAAGIVLLRAEREA